MDLIDINILIDQGYTSLALYFSNTPEGPYEDSGVTSDPATLAALVLAGEPYLSTFAYASGNASQWFKVLAKDGATTSSLNDALAFHGGGGTNLERIRRKIGKLIKCVEIGTTTSNGVSDGSTAICQQPTFTRRRDSYFGGSGFGEDGHIFYRNDTDEWTEIVGWDQSTGQFQFNPAFSTQVMQDTSFEVYSRFTPDEIRDDINWAITNTFPTLSRPVVDLSIVTEDNVWQYDIPNNIKILNNVEVESKINNDETNHNSKGHPWRAVPYEDWIDGLSRKIEFLREPPFEDNFGGYRLRLTGTTLLNYLYYDSDYVEVIEPQVELICYLAAYKLYLDLTNTSSSNDKDLYKEQAAAYLSLYEQFKKTMGTRRRSRRNWSRDSKWSVNRG